MKKWLKRIIPGLIVIVLVMVLGIVGIVFSLHEPKPVGTPGPEAEKLAEAVQKAVGVGSWHKVGAISWDFGGRQQHLWDRTRQYARVRWENTEVLLDLTSRKGLAFEGGEPVAASQVQPLLDKAWKFWCNDSFWLNPIAKITDQGVTRSIVKLPDGSQGLLVSYSSGGVTPGDAYLWILGENNVPVAWKMWVDIIPIGGLEVSWEEWLDLEPGAKIATVHEAGVLTLRLTDVQTADSAATLSKGVDPFAKLVKIAPPKPAPESVPSSKPASAP